MRTFSESVQSNITKKQGVEIVLFIGVQWADGSETFYSSTEFQGARKSIITVGDMQTSPLAHGNGTSQSVNVVLSDTDGHLTDILNTIDIHKRPAKVYLGFPGVPLDQSVVLLDGEVNSDMTWDERSRSLQFTILSKTETRPFGFAVEDGLFHRVDRSQRTTPWPFRFGETCVYPTVRISNGVQGFLRTPQGVVDPTLDTQICQAQQIKCPYVPIGAQNSGEIVYGDSGTQTTTSSLGGTSPNGLSGWTVSTALGAVSDPTRYIVSNACGTVVGIAPTYRKVSSLEDNRNRDPEGGCEGDMFERDRDCERTKFEKLCQLLRSKADQLQWQNSFLTIAGGDDFPQNQEVKILVGDVLYTGSFSGEFFTITDTDRLDTGVQPDCTKVGPYAYGYRAAKIPVPGTLAECASPNQGVELKAVGGAGDAFRRLDDIESDGFKWLPAGTRVVLQNSSTEVHIVSCVPGTVDQVMAYRTSGDTKILTVVPASYYEVVNVNYGDLQTVEVHLVKPLTGYKDENWDAEVFVSFTSDVGPNPVDVIEWIADKYTDLSIDATSFATVKSDLTNYPCNFYYASKRSALDVIQQVAYEARCAIVITDNTLKLRYLPKEPNSVREFTKADYVAGTLQFSHTRTEELETSYKITWAERGAENVSTDEADNLFTIENNVEKYGYFAASDEFRTISDEQQALKTATFWSIRNSNTWRIVSLSTTIENLDLELFDCITLNTPHFPNVKTMVRSVSFNPETGLVDLELWTPVLSGTNAKYFFAWPAAQPAADPYPSDNFSIEPPIVAVTPPSDHPLFIDDPNPAVRATTGDRFPSDLDDTLPSTECQDPTDSLTFDVLEPTFAELDLQSAASRADMNARSYEGPNFHAPRAAGEDGFSDGREKEDDIPPGEETGLCKWEIVIQYATAETIAEGTGSGFDCDILPGPCKTTGTGARCSGPTTFRTQVYGSQDSAQLAVDLTNAYIEENYCNWTVGKFAPVGVVGPTAKESTGCEEIDTKLFDTDNDIDG